MTPLYVTDLARQRATMRRERRRRSAARIVSLLTLLLLAVILLGAGLFVVGVILGAVTA